MNSPVVLALFERRGVSDGLIEPAVIVSRFGEYEHQTGIETVAPMRPAFAVMTELAFDRVHRIVIERVFLKQRFHLILRKVKGALQLATKRLPLRHRIRHLSFPPNRFDSLPVIQPESP